MKNVSIFLFSFAVLFVAMSFFDSWKKITVPTVSVFLTLSVIELVTPLAWEPYVNPEHDPQLVRFDDKSGYLTESYWSMTVNPDLGLTPRPGLYDSRKITAANHVIYDVTYTIGDDGFRITPNNGKETVTRVNFFGGSFTFGEGLEDNQTLPYFLGQNLGVEAKNFGFHGWGAHNALAILQSGRDTNGAVNVFLTAPWHVPRSSCAYWWTKGSPRYELNTNGNVFLSGYCLEENIFGAFRRIVERSNIYLLFYSVYQNLFRTWITERQLDLYFALIKEIASISDIKGQYLVIGILDWSDINGLPIESLRFCERLNSIGAAIVDLSLTDDTGNLPSEYYHHELDGHPTALANAQRAHLLEPVLREILEY